MYGIGANADAEVSNSNKAVEKGRYRQSND